MAAKEFGVVGLGRMGGGLAWQALGKGYSVVGIDLSPPSEDLIERELRYSNELKTLKELGTPKKGFRLYPCRTSN